MYSAPSKASKIKLMTLTGMMTALICITAPFSLPLPVSPVPISLGTLAIYLSIVVLEPGQSFCSILLYLLLGLVGLPVFTGFSGGAGKLLGPTGGYLIGYLFLALIGGFFAGRAHGRIIPNLIGMLLGTAVCYLFGTLWLAYQSHIGLSAAFLTAVLPFLPFDFLKIAAALLMGRQIKSRLTRVGLL